MANWQLQEAKAQFSEVVRQAESQGPQHISVRGKPAVVVLSQRDYLKLRSKSGRPGFLALMRSSPWAGLELEIERDRSLTRDTPLSD